MLDPPSSPVRLEAGPEGWFARRPMRLGERVVLTGLEIEITRMRPDGRPAEATFRFERPLEDASLRFLQAGEGGFVPFRLPPVGGRVRLPAHAFVR